MPKITYAYSDDMYSKLKTAVKNWAATGKEYEIIIDRLQMVPRTDNPELLENLDDMVNDASDTVTFVQYPSKSSNNNNKTTLIIGGESTPRGLGNAPIIDEEAIRSQERSAILNKLREEKLAELERENESLRNEVAQLKNSLGAGVNKLGTVIQENPLLLQGIGAILAKISGGLGLGGLPDAVPVATLQLSSEDKQALDWAKGIAEAFSDDEIEKLETIISSLEENKSNLDTIVQLLTQQRQYEQV